MAGYTRQSVADIINGSDITAPPINAEFNQIQSAFNGTTGHSHDGSAGNAPKIDLATSLSGYLPAAHGGVGGKNKLDATAAPTTADDAGEGYAPGSLWENTTNGRVYICVGNTSNAAVWRELVTVITDNQITPVGHDEIDLGTPTVRFQDLYLSGGISASGNVVVGGTLTQTGNATLSGTLSITGAVTASGDLSVSGTTSLNGNVDLGDADTDTVTVNAKIDSDFVPSGSRNLGSSTDEWTNLFVDGTAHIDTLDVDENATIAGTLGVTGTTTYSTLTGSNLTATGTINFAGATVSNLGTVTTAAIGGGTINNAVIGGSTPAAITGTTITGTSFVGPLTGNVTGNVTGNLTGNVTGDVTGDLTGNVTATSGTSNFTNVTISGQLNMDASSAATITNLTAPSNDLDAATKLYVDTAVSNLVDSAPDSLNTLNELAAAINDDASAYNTLNTAIGNKLPKAGGTMSGAINMGGQKITNAADPTAAQDLATKNYIDTTYVDYSSAGDAANDAEKLAVNAEDVQYTLSDGTTTGFSALHYAAKAAASYDSFDDRYLGSKASDPTLDNDNNALITGALYFDSTNSVMKVYNGSEWANASSSIEGIKANFYYTATSGQTVFSGSDDNTNTLVVDQVDLVNVYMNGVRLHEDDYTVSAAGNSVTLATGAATGDLIYLEVFGNFTGQSGAEVAITGGSITGLSDFGAAQGAFTGNVTFGDNDKAIFGTGSDLQIYHDGSNSYISDQGTGDLRILAGHLSVKSASGNTDMIYAVNGGAVTLYNNGSPKLATTSTGIDVSGTVTADGLTVDNAGTIQLTKNTTAAGDSLGIIEFHDEDGTASADAGKFQLQAFRGGDKDAPDFKLIGSDSTGVLRDRILVEDNGDISFYEDTGTTAKFFWDASAESLTLTGQKDSTSLNLSASLVTVGGGTLADYNQVYFDNTAGTGDAYIRHYSNAHSDSHSALAFGTADNGALAERLRIDSSGRVGIGTSSPSSQIHISSSSGATLRLERDDTTITSGNIYGNILFTGNDASSGASGARASILVLGEGAEGQAALTFKTAGSGTAAAERLRIDSSGNVGIGTDSPSVPLEVNVSGAGDVFKLTRDAGSAGELNIDFNGANANFNSEQGGYNFETSAATNVLVLSSSGNVGIGTSSPSTNLHVKSSAFGDIYPIKVEDGGGTAGLELGQYGSVGQVNGLTGLDFEVGKSLKMRIDSSGNLLVGTTDTTPYNNNAGTSADQGFVVNNGRIYAATNGNSVSILNRTYTDGDIIQFRKDGSTVGSIGSNAGTHLYAGSNDTGLLFQGTANAIEPWNVSSNAARDDSIDLGITSNRFRKAYLGQNVFVRTTSLGGFVDSAAIQSNGGTGHGAAFQTDATSGFAAACFSRDSNNGAVQEFFYAVGSSAVGTITITSSSTSYNTSSDYRLKTDVQPMTGASARVQALNPVNFEWIADGTRVDGFLAHEAQAVVPEAVTGTKDAVDADGNPEYQGIDQSKLVPLLTAALQEALTKIDALEARITTLEG